MRSIKLFKVVAKVGNPSLFSGATAVQNRPKSYAFTVNLAVSALHAAKMTPKTLERSMRGGFFKISLEFRKGWFCIRCHLFIRICLR